MVKKIKISESKSLKEYVEGDIVTWKDLNEEQKNYVVDNAYRYNKLSWIWEFYNESIMEWYHEQVAELASKYEKQGISINTDKIYWQSNSQGPCPEWRFEDIFDTVYVDYDDGEVDINIYGRGTEPDMDFDLTYTVADGDWAYEYNLDQEDLRNPEYNIPGEVIEDVEAKLYSVIKFTEELWGLINEVCQAYPDDEYIKGELDAYPDDDFMIISDTEARPINV